MKTKSLQLFLNLAFLLALFQLVVAPSVVHGQDAANRSTVNQAAADGKDKPAGNGTASTAPDQALQGLSVYDPEEQDDGSEQQGMFFAFLREDKKALDGPFVNLLKDKPLVQDIISPRDRVARKYRPMLQWKRWADKKQRLIPALFLIGMVSLLFWSLFPVKLQEAVVECKSHYWRCFGIGVLILAFSSMLARAVFVTEIGWPLGILITGLTQCALLAGLSVVVYNLGHSMMLLSQLSKISFLANNPARARVCDLLLGTLLIALLLKIPALGPLPQLGTRLVSFFALLGLGAIFRICKRDSSKS